jgi:hypothetical protein
MLKELKKLEVIKEIVEKNIQEAVNELISYALFLEDEGLIDCEYAIWGKYVEYGNFSRSDIVNEYDFELSYDCWYENIEVEEGLIVKEITKESVLNTIVEFENLIKEYTIDSYEIEAHCKDGIYNTIIKDKEAIEINYTDKNSKNINELIIDSIYDIPFHFKASETNKIYITKIINSEYVGEKSLLIEF